VLKITLGHMHVLYIAASNSVMNLTYICHVWPQLTLILDGHGHPRTGHEGPGESRCIALLFL